jgi:hypothetical protein
MLFDTNSLSNSVRYGDGNGYGDGYGYGYGSGDGHGDGYGDGHGYGSADGHGYGSGDGHGDGSGYSDGDGSGSDFDHDIGLYNHTRTEDTISIATLSKAAELAIQNEIKETEQYLEELKIQLKSYTIAN